MIFNYSYSYKQNPFSYGSQPVSVIASFAVDGRFIPIYFKYISDEDTLTFKIDGIQYTKDKADCIIFCCNITNNNIRQQVNLIFKYNECMWLLGEG